MSKRTSKDMLGSRAQEEESVRVLGNEGEEEDMDCRDEQPRFGQNMATEKSPGAGTFLVDIPWEDVLFPSLLPTLSPTDWLALAQTSKAYYHLVFTFLRYASSIWPPSALWCSDRTDG